MAIQIKSVTVTPNTVTVGQSFSIKIAAEEVYWSTLKDDFTDWGEVRRSFTNWNRVKDYIYSVPNPVPTAECVCTCDGNELFDVDAIQISISGGCASQYDGATINQFIGEVVNG